MSVTVALTGENRVASRLCLVKDLLQERIDLYLGSGHGKVRSSGR